MAAVRWSSREGACCRRLPGPGCKRLRRQRHSHATHPWLRRYRPRRQQRRRCRRAARQTTGCLGRRRSARAAAGWSGLRRPPPQPGARPTLRRCARRPTVPPASALSIAGHRPEASRCAGWRQPTVGSRGGGWGVGRRGSVRGGTKRGGAAAAAPAAGAAAGSRRGTHRHKLLGSLAALQGGAAAVDGRQPLHRLAFVLAKRAKRLQAGGRRGGAHVHVGAAQRRTPPR